MQKDERYTHKKKVEHAQITKKQREAVQKQIFKAVSLIKTDKHIIGKLNKLEKYNYLIFMQLIKADFKV